MSTYYMPKLCTRTRYLFHVFLIMKEFNPLICKGERIIRFIPICFYKSINLNYSKVVINWPL